MGSGVHVGDLLERLRVTCVTQSLEIVKGDAAVEFVI